MNKLALILVASVLAASSVNADEIPNLQGCPQPGRVSNSAESAGVTTLLGCPDKPKPLPKENAAGLPTAADKAKAATEVQECLLPTSISRGPVTR